MYSVNVYAAFHFSRGGSRDSPCGVCRNLSGLNLQQFYHKGGCNAFLNFNRNMSPFVLFAEPLSDKRDMLDTMLERSKNELIRVEQDMKLDALENEIMNLQGLLHNVDWKRLDEVTKLKLQLHSVEESRDRLLDEMKMKVESVQEDSRLFVAKEEVKAISIAVAQMVARREEAEALQNNIQARMKALEQEVAKKEAEEAAYMELKAMEAMEENEAFEARLKALEVGAERDRIVETHLKHLAEESLKKEAVAAAKVVSEMEAKRVVEAEIKAVVETEERKRQAQETAKQNTKKMKAEKKAKEAAEAEAKKSEQIRKEYAAKKAEEKRKRDASMELRKKWFEEQEEAKYDRFYETNRLAQDGIAINAWQAGNKRRNVQDGGSVSNSVKRLGL